VPGLGGRCQKQEYRFAHPIWSPSSSTRSLDRQLIHIRAVPLSRSRMTYCPPSATITQCRRETETSLIGTRLMHPFPARPDRRLPVPALRR
jgi:hypothetical protein